MASTEWFNVAALLIMFREALEAAIIIAVLLQLVAKLNMKHLRRWIWFGALLGVAVSILIGVIFVLVFYLANTKLLDDKAQNIFKGTICWVAALLITIVAFAMLKFYNLERKWKAKLEAEMQKTSSKEQRSYKWSMFLLAGSATLREGIESVLFLTGVSAGSSVKSVILPGIVGIILGFLCGAIVYFSGKQISSLKWFFIVSALLLLFISGGMVVNGTMFYQISGLFGTMWPYEKRPWSNKVLWDVSSCCDPNDNEGWALMRALFGWQAQVLNLQFLYYMLYWALTLLLLYLKYRSGTLTDKHEAEIAEVSEHEKEQEEQVANEMVTAESGKFTEKSDVEPEAKYDNSSDDSPEAVEEADSTKLENESLFARLRSKFRKKSK